MAATITITLSDEILRILDSERSIEVTLDSAAGSRGAGRAGVAARAAPAGGYRAGSLPGTLVQWAAGRKQFGVRDVMKALGIKRAHASMVLTRVMASGHLKRVGRGTYAAA